MANTRALNIRLNDADRAALKRLAKRLQLDTEADVVRWLIRNANKAEASAPPPAPRVAAPAEEAEGFD